jgi:hypothetical protein
VIDRRDFAAGQPEAAGTLIENGSVSKNRDWRIGNFQSPIESGRQQRENACALSFLPARLQQENSMMLLDIPATTRSHTVIAGV